MEEKEIVALVEKAVGENLNEEKLSGIIDKSLHQHLKALPASLVHVGDAPGTEEKAAGVTFSQTLADIKRVHHGQPVKHLPSEGAVIKAALNTASGEQGGYLVPTEESRQIIDLTRALPGIAPLCQQVPMRTAQLTFPTLTGGVTAYWIPEATDDVSGGNPSTYTQAAGHIPSSIPATGQVALNAYALGVRVVLSNQLLDDSEPSVDGVIRGLFAKAISKAFDIAIQRGVGVAASTVDPIKGLDNRITTNRLAVGAEFNFDDIVDLIFRVYEHDSAVTQVPIIGHPKAEKVLMKIKDGDGQYVYRQPSAPGGGAEKVPAVWGEPFQRNGNILTNLGAANNETKLYAGDFAGHAYVGNRQGVAIKVIDQSEPYVSHNQTAFIAIARMGFSLDDEACFSVLEGVPTN
jgi:HK97 family phage major capsid protein